MGMRISVAFAALPAGTQNGTRITNAADAGTLTSTAARQGCRFGDRSSDEWPAERRQYPDNGLDRKDLRDQSPWKELRNERIAARNDDAFGDALQGAPQNQHRRCGGGREGDGSGHECGRGQEQNRSRTEPDFQYRRDRAARD
jgi:hypothetical protein